MTQRNAAAVKLFTLAGSSFSSRHAGDRLGREASFNSMTSIWSILRPARFQRLLRGGDRFPSPCSWDRRRDGARDDPGEGLLRLGADEQGRGTIV